METCYSCRERPAVLLTRIYNTMLTPKCIPCAHKDIRIYRKHAKEYPLRFGKWLTTIVKLPSS